MAAAPDSLTSNELPSIAHTGDNGSCGIAYKERAIFPQRIDLESHWQHCRLEFNKRFGTRSSPPIGYKAMVLKMTRILIADDHPVVLRGLRSLLTTHKGWEVCGEVRTGAETVKLAKQLRPDILIMGISIQAMNGLEALRQVRQFDPHIGVLMFTMDDSEPMFRGAMEAGAHAYVLKSDLDKTVIEAVEALCEGRAFFSPGIFQTLRKGLMQGAGRAQPGTHDPNGLTPRQREVLRLVASGKSNKEVANELCISVRTAETHRHQIMSRLKVRTLSDLVLFAVRNNMIKL